MRDDVLYVQDSMWDLDFKVTNCFAEINDKVENINATIEAINVKADQIKAAINNLQLIENHMMRELLLQNERMERKIDQIAARLMSCEQL